jgi:3-oxoacyl-[acyl-carrier protein] reductase
VARTPDYFNSKTIIITGAGSGIGRATAEIFGRERANVICADISESGARQAAADVDAAGGKGKAIVVDVTKRDSVKRLIAESMAAFGSIHFMFNSAGAAFRRCKFLEMDDELWDKTFDLNVKGTLYGMQEVIPHMLDNKFGVIVNVASIAAKQGGPGKSPHYAASKGAVNTLTMGAAREFADRNIRILSVSPAVVDTPFQNVNEPGLLEKTISMVPLGRAGRADEIGELVLFLCSDACTFMTADTVMVTGGTGYR